MILYHGGLIPVPVPRIIRGDRIGDFGIGFYATTDLEQARRFAIRKCSVSKADAGCVSVYAVPDNILDCGRWKVKRFSGATREWIDFVFANRKTPNYGHDFDIVYGPVANDQVYASLSLFENGMIGRSELVRRLKTRKLTDQMLFHTEEALKELRFAEALEVSC